MNRRNDDHLKSGINGKESVDLSEKRQSQKDETGEQPEYHFLKEVIKKKPVEKKKIFYGLACIVAGAVLFGSISALVFQATLSHAEKAQTTKVELPKEKLTPTYLPSETPTPTPEASQTKEDLTGQQEEKAEKRPIDMEQFRDIYRQMMEIVKEPEKCMVTVKGITSSVDWMNNEYENYSQVAGVIIAENPQEYFILTEYRAVAQVDRILITVSDGTAMDAHFQQQDRATGLAVLNVAKAEMDTKTRNAVAVAQLGETGCISRGEPVLALGSPAGYGNSVAYGMITSTKNRKSTIDREYHVLTTDMMGNAEGSGVLIDLDGHVVGVISQNFSSENNKNSVVAIPINELKDVIERLSNREETSYLGVRGQNISKDLSEKTGIPRGIYVHEVLPDSPAMAAGIQNGDVIIGFNEINIEKLTQLGDVLDSSRPEEKINVTGMRKGAEGYVEIVFDVTLGAL